ncbi:MAG: S1 RNA-binding domain-containing protein [Pyrinomonadaceae bacterium]
MTNELTKDAEESETIEKTAIEQSEPTTATAEAAALQPDETPAAEQSLPQEAAVSEPIQEPSAEAPVAPTTSPFDAVATTPEPSPPQETKPAAAPAAPVAEESTTEETAASNDIDFGAILEQFEQEQTVYHQGDLVEGTVVGISDRGVLVDFGYKSEGFVPPEEFTSPEGEMTVSVGDKVEVVIRTMHSGDAAPQLSRTDALGRKVWEEIEAAFVAEKPIGGRIVDKTKGGLRVDLNGIEAFLPGSQIDSYSIRSLDSYIGQDIEAKIIKFSRKRNNIVLSRKVITDEVVNAQKAETLSRIELGFVVEGTIKNLTEYGAFVDIGGIDGLLHVTDMSWGRIHHPADQFKVGEHMQLKVLKLDKEREKVSLGYKQLLPDPWSTVVEVYPVNTKLKGIVSSVTEYGVFVELEPGVEGLVHASEISWAKRAQSPKRLFHKGQEVEVQVLGVDTVEKRISLGMRQFQENPWESVHEKYPVGSKVHGRIRNLTDFGAFVELEAGIDGLVHVSDISWAKKIKHPKDVLKKDQEVDAIVTSIDKNSQRLSLSMKDLTPSAWESFVATHRPGDVVRGKVSRFTNFGVFVELGEGLEGLCHISELSDERVEKAEEVAKLGQEMDFKILRIETGDQKIGLSHRAVGKDDQPVVDSKIYSTEAKGGMASLGELASLKFGAAEEAPPEIDPEEKKKAKQAAKKAKAEEFAAKQAEAEAAEAEKVATAEAPAEQPVAETEAPEAESDTTAEASTELPVAETEAAEAEKAATAAESAEQPVAETEAAETSEAPAEETVTAEVPTEEVTSEPEAAAETEEAAVGEVASETETVAEETTAVAETEEAPAAAEVSETVEEAAPTPEAKDEEPATENEIAETPKAEIEEAPAQETAAESETVTEETPADEKPAEDAEGKTA